MADNQQMKVGVIGLGPVGMIIAVHLQEAGCNVVLCDTDRIKLSKIRSQGISLSGVIEKKTCFSNFCASIGEMKEHDLDVLLFATKAQHMSGLLKDAVSLKTDKLTVVSAQNGIDTEKILVGAFGASRTLRMVINFAGNLNAPNEVKVTFFNPPNFIGSIDDNNAEVAKDLSQVLNTASLSTDMEDAAGIQKKVWQKTILNAGLSPLCGVGRLTMAEAMSDVHTLALVKETLAEGVEVAAAEGMHFSKDFIEICLGYLRKGGNHFPSLAGDFINNRPTEIDFFNGKIVEYGQKHNIKTSVNLTFVNMVKAMTDKHIASSIPVGLKSEGEKQVERKTAEPIKTGDCFLGVDLGSTFTKVSVIDEDHNVLFQTILQTFNRNKEAMKQVIQAVYAEYPIKYNCATGYGRKHLAEANMAKTEIKCASVGANKYFPGEKNVIDIGGEDIKVIRCDANGNVENFYLNDKCASGTGSFITEICERAELDVAELSKLAQNSDFKDELNSFCTVFAKTEIMKWIFDGVSVENLAKGIYISIANRIAKLRIDSAVPIYMIGGVIAHHPFLGTLLQERYTQPVQVVEKPQHVVSLGAAIIAAEFYKKNKEEIQKNLTSEELAS